jgi:hypothetical protein
MAHDQFSQRRRRKAIFRTMRSRTQYGEKSGDLLLALGAVVLVMAVLALRWQLD